MFGKLHFWNEKKKLNFHILNYNKLKFNSDITGVQKTYRSRAELFSQCMCPSSGAASSKGCVCRTIASKRCEKYCVISSSPPNAPNKSPITKGASQPSISQDSWCTADNLFFFLQENWGSSGVTVAKLKMEISHIYMQMLINMYCPSFK